MPMNKGMSLFAFFLSFLCFLFRELNQVEFVKYGLKYNVNIS